MDVFSEYVAGIDDPFHRERTEEVLTWIKNKYPNLHTEIKNGINQCLRIMVHLLLALVYLKSI